MSALPPQKEDHATSFRFVFLSRGMGWGGGGGRRGEAKYKLQIVVEQTNLFLLTKIIGRLQNTQTHIQLHVLFTFTKWLELSQIAEHFPISS